MRQNSLQGKPILTRALNSAHVGTRLTAILAPVTTVDLEDTKVSAAIVVIVVRGSSIIAALVAGRADP